MTYEESFLSTCDAEGLAPVWALTQILEEHGFTTTEYVADKGDDFNGETILDWLGY